jgi:hypothetical protein
MTRRERGEPPSPLSGAYAEAGLACVDGFADGRHGEDASVALSSADYSAAEFAGRD